MRNICNEVELNGGGLNDFMKNHGLHSSMTASLTDVAHKDSSVILRTGHCNTTTLARYDNLHGMKGLRQQESLFQSSDDKAHGDDKDNDDDNGHDKNIASKNRRQVQTSMQ